MGRRRHFAAAATAVFALVCSGAWAAGAPDEPDLQAMALAPADFDGGAVVASQGAVTAPPPFVGEYERFFRPGAHLAGRRLLYAANIDFSLDDASTTQQAFALLVQQLNTPSGRKQIASSLLAGLRKGTHGKVTIRSLSVGRPVSLQVGQGAFRVTILVKTNVGRIEQALTGLRVDRVIGLTLVSAYPKSRLTNGPATLATARLAKRFAAGLVLHNTVAPTVVGTPQQGQALTADPGHWSGGPGAFAYQWNRCPASGAACAPIPGATGQSYVPTSADSGSKVSVTVTASNSVSQAAETSAPVGPVP